MGVLGMYDELSAFLTKIKLYSNRGLSDSHELAMFLELYNANPWTRTTGKFHTASMCTIGRTIGPIYIQCLSYVIEWERAKRLCLTPTHSLSVWLIGFGMTYLKLYSYGSLGVKV